MSDCQVQQKRVLVHLVTCVPSAENGAGSWQVPREARMKDQIHIWSDGMVRTCAKCTGAWPAKVTVQLSYCFAVFSNFTSFVVTI